VQAAVITEEAQGRDLLVSAQTGSGKTVAFGMAMSRDLLGDAERLSYAGKPLALVIAPTRELALQVSRELEWLYQPAGARIATCVGGMDPSRERRTLSHGAHIVVGTPGRLRDHLERGALDLSNLQFAVLDEADEMLDMGFREDLEQILDGTPEGAAPSCSRPPCPRRSPRWPASIRTTRCASARSTRANRTATSPITPSPSARLTSSMPW
jgi:ATP-dependent RNA helicase DeaD